MADTLRLVGSQVTMTLTAVAQPIPLPPDANRLWVQSLVQDSYIRFDASPASAIATFQIRAGDPTVEIERPGGATLSAVQGVSGAILIIQPLARG